MGDDNEETNLTLEGGWEWKRPKLIGTIYTISNHDRLKTLKDIEKVLSTFEDDDVYDNLVRSSCFSNFFLLPENFERCNKGVHYVMSREIRRSDGSGDDTELWFRIKDKNIRFSRYEFALVSGLRFGSSEFEPDFGWQVGSDSLYIRLLKGKPVVVNTLLEKFMEKKFESDPLDYLKIGKVLFVTLVLFGIDPRHNVPNWLWALVEDDDMWESFPWGSFAYQRLLYYLKKIPIEEGDQTRLSYHIYACSFLLTTWIYEAIELFGSTCGMIRNKKAIPRMLRYEYRWSNMSHDVIKGKVHSMLKPGKREKNSAYWESIESGPFLASLPRNMFRERRVTKSVKESANDEGDHDESNIDHRYQPVGDEGPSMSHVYGPSDPIMQCTMSQFQHFIHQAVEASAERASERAAERAAERAFSKTETWLTSYLPEMVNYNYNYNNSQVDSPDSPDRSWGWSPRNDWGYQQSDTVPTNENENVVAVSPGWSMHIRNEDGPSHGTWRTSTSIGTGDEWTTPRGQRPFRSIGPISYPPYSTPSSFQNFNPVRRRMEGASLKSPFIPYENRNAIWETWIKETRGRGMRNVGLGYAVDVKFFTSILDNETDLTNGHIDSYLAILHCKPSFVNLRTKNVDIAITSCEFNNVVRMIFEKYHNLENTTTLDPKVEQFISNEDLEVLAKYVTGENPGWFPPKPWHQFNKVAIVCHIHQHWVTLLVDLKKNDITLFDSKQHLWHDDENVKSLKKAHFIPLARVLPQVLKYSGFWDSRPELTPKYTQWTLMMPPTPERNPYKQEDSNSCGLFALRYVESFLSELSYPMHTEGDIKDYRKRVSMAIFKFSIEV